MSLEVNNAHRGCNHKSSTDPIPGKKSSKYDLFMKILHKVCAVVLGVFAASVDLKLFIPYFFVGVMIGIYTYINNTASCGHANSNLSCAQGIESLTGVKLPAPIALLIFVAVTICHIDHHSNVFVPSVAITIGAWAGNVGSYYSILLYKKITPHFPAAIAA